ncbi:thiamine monophosphate synthase/TENI family protein [Burkholderia ambifaria AMMD]|uniref:Thiamine-phosphate synthase n=2 Tax=Burkholderia ambifaria TaxID=152480 RepID=Q0BIY2_BURCM|nr:thiamine phosphate synthase [Burkholderia ambifaria]ABI85891.1 thiamine-phosphate diphosphorylase [Burkholderia ambifaria AMMD]AJY23352.1 thiamine monophosphate synthase/TENI family protein [Burkholderia ambifaria AMMD]MBR7933181.1 thiamine phosphate synthase [Burkholderia ambifaria]PEH66775.1 thiamine phosphate synthase [Burkholderia ambifaria]QQC03754.1 thiamine phosphate synthase [Burkholderia ambifaria]
MSERFADAFWPPADELAEAAERIRARLGDWPAGTTPWRLCVAAPDVPVDGDVLIVSAGDRAAQARASAASRPAAPDAVAIEFDEHGATLHAAGVRHALEAAHPLGDDWIAALAAFLDCGFAPIDALVLALAWRDGDETRGADAWPVDAARFPRVAGLAAAPEPAFPPCPAQLGLYPVVPDAEWVERVLDCGARTVQLRVKGAHPAALRGEIARAVAAGRRYPDARVFINDHWQIAVEEGAYGVHLGQEDLETADLAAIAHAGLRLGLSSHGYYEMLRALHERPSYLALGPVYATATKAVAAPPQGLARIARYARFAGARAPLVAIGGVGLDALPDVLATGVGSVAVVSAITGAIDYRAAVVALQQCFARQFDNH